MKFVFKRFDKLSSAEVYEILKARAQIFIVEQGMNCLDPDGEDYNAIHIFLKDEQGVVAYLRALPARDDATFKIGRVLTTNHRLGYGRELVCRAIDELKNQLGCKKIILHSQKTAVGFYEKLGFVKTSDEFLEEGVSHFSMELIIN